MNSVFGTAYTPFGFCGFGFIDDETFFKMMGNKIGSDAQLKDCKINPSDNLKIEQKKICPKDSQLQKKEALKQLKIQMDNNPQLKEFLSKMPKEIQQSMIQQMVDTIIKCL